MSVAKTIEITAGSSESFEAAVAVGVKKAAESVQNIQSVWVKDQSASVDGDTISEYRVNMKVTFLVS